MTVARLIARSVAGLFAGVNSHVIVAGSFAGLNHSRKRFFFIATRYNFDIPRLNFSPAPTTGQALDSFKKDVYQQAIPLGEGTSNTAEYYGLIYGLLACIELGIKKI